MPRMRTSVTLSCLLMGLLLATGPAFSQADPQLFVEGVDIDYSNANLSISGAHFNNGSAPVVTLAGTEVPVTEVSSDGKELTVSLPSTFSTYVGSYLLTVSTGSTASQRDVFALTLGAVGPQGPKGEDGAPGAVGPAGSTGLASLTKTSVVAAGANCSAGGVKVETGLDSNRNALLEAWEVSAAMTRYVCDGIQGPQGLKGDTGLQGPQGPKGDVGHQGTQGLKGDMGLSALTKTTAVAAGSNCAAGGLKVETGVDSNRNALLDTTEVDATMTRYICNGTQGSQGLKGDAGFAALTKTTAVAGGANCVAGGVKLETGLDSNRNALLDASEVDATMTRYICNGNQGPQGNQGMPGSQGPRGDPGAQGVPGIPGAPKSFACTPVAGGFAKTSSASCGAPWWLSGGACQQGGSQYFGISSWVSGNTYSCAVREGSNTVQAHAICCLMQ
ncbi:DUF7151 family protein [Stigmatella ashevillensis]|uniref:DUF7151 family protein n=1 Tax=Stigmatella ashevillensis TaxID=2995309 RepID=UPI0040329EF4